MLNVADINVVADILRHILINSLLELDYNYTLSS